LITVIISKSQIFLVMFIQASSKTWILHLQLEDSDRDSCEAVVEIGVGTQHLISSLQEGHALCMTGAEVTADLSSAPSWAAPLVKSIAATHVGQQAPGQPLPVIVWTDASPGCKIYDLTGMPGIMNSAAAMLPSAFITYLEEPKEGKLLRMAYVHILHAEVETRREHR
jgi:hypothetical protein